MTGEETPMTETTAQTEESAPPKFGPYNTESAEQVLEKTPQERYMLDG